MLIKHTNFSYDTLEDSVISDSKTDKKYKTIEKHKSIKKEVNKDIEKSIINNIFDI